jgi:PAS domain-containing protein
MSKGAQAMVVATRDKALETARKRALEHLRESQNKYRALFEGVPVGLYRTSPEGKLLDLNPTMARMLGFGQECPGKGSPRLLS